MHFKADIMQNQLIVVILYADSGKRQLQCRCFVFLTAFRAFQLKVDRNIPHHCRDDLLLAEAISAFKGTDMFALTQNCDSVSHSKDLVNFVRDQEDPIPLIAESAQHLQKSLHFVRCQHACGLIENHHTGLRIQQNLQDLHMLPLSEVKLPNLRVRIHGKAILRRDSINFIAKLLFIDLPPGRMEGKEYIFQNCESRNEPEILKYHSDTLFAGNRRIPALHFFSVNIQISGSRLIDTIEHLHQRTFSRTVLACYRMDFTGVDFDVNLPVCRQFSESFREFFRP